MIKELFLKIEQTNNTVFFDRFNEDELFFSYFHVDENYYLFLYTNQFINIDLFYENFTILQEMDTKQRKLRLLRGFLLYVLEIMKAGDCEILKTNLKPFFLIKVEKIIRQNKKKLLLDFLFKSQTTNEISSTTDADFEKQFKALEKNLNSLQERVIYLENKNREMEAHLNILLEGQNIRFKSYSNIRQGDFYLEGEKI